MSSKILDKVYSLATPRRITSITTAIIMIALTGVFQFLSLGMDLECLTKSSFYLTLGYRAALVILAYNCALDFLFDRCLNHPNIVQAYNTFKELSKMRDTNFEEFLDVVNFENKKRAWKEKINLQISRLEKKIANTDNPKRREKIKTNIDNKKLLLTDEYIKEHFDYLKVRYYKVLPSDFVAGEFEGGNYERNKTRTDYSSQRSRSTLKKVVPFILTSMVLGATVAGSFDKPALVVVLGLLWDLALISMRFGQGCFDSQKLVNSSYLIPYNNRIEILKQYIVWNKDNPVSKANKVVAFIEKQEDQREETKNGN